MVTFAERKPKWRWKTQDEGNELAFGSLHFKCRGDTQVELCREQLVQALPKQARVGGSGTQNWTDEDL